VSLLIGLVAVPSFAASQKTVSLNVSPSSAPVTTSSPGYMFSLKVTNTTPGSSNPSSFRITVPSTTTPAFTGTGFKIVSAAIDQANSTNGSNSSALPPVYNSAKTTVDFNNISPIQQFQYITVNVWVTTPSICPSTSALTSDWLLNAYTGSTVGQAQPFTTTNYGPATKTTLTASSCPSAPGSFSISADKTSFIPGVDSVTLSSSAVSGSPAPTITWQYSSTSGFSSPTTKGTGSSLALTPAQASDAGYYRAVASNGVNPDSTSTNTIHLTEAALSLEFTTPPTDAVKGTRISGMANDPTGADVQVQLKVDGNASSAMDGTGVTITRSGGGTNNLSGYTATLGGGGLASFPSLSIDTAGDYTLVASVDAGGPSTDGVDIVIGDGILGCGEQTDNVAGAQVDRLDNADGSICPEINYIFDFDGNQLTFLKDLSFQPEAQFKISVNAYAPEDAVLPLPITQVDGGPSDTPDGFHPIEWCKSNAMQPSSLPDGEVICLLDQHSEVLPSGKIQVSETYYLYGDMITKR
jgi:Immunoglobulin domain